MKILPIDDNQDITITIHEYPTIKGHECTVSNDRRNGLTLIEQQKFDVILLDLAMPEFTGIDIMDSLHDSGEINSRKIVLSTASSVKDDEIRDLMKKGVHSCLKKPMKSDVLVKAIRG